MGRMKDQLGQFLLTQVVTQPLKPLLSASWPRLHRVGGMAMWTLGLDTLKHNGFAPRTVFDIGVAAGTRQLYSAFPEAHFVLVDPTRQSLPHMQRIARRLDAEICNFALGDPEGEMEIEARRDDINGATFFKEIGPLGPTDRYRVPVRRFDAAFTDFSGPTLCKIDVQGSELMVLRGMGQAIDRIDVFILEIGLLATIADAPEAFDVIAFLNHQGFVMFDILGLERRPLDDALAQMDVLFVKRESTLRADRRWRSSL